MFSTLTRHRVSRRRDHDPLGMRIEDTLRELDEQNNVLSSVLREPLPEVVDREGDDAHLNLMDGDGEAVRGHKRRRIDSNFSFKPIPKYAFAGRVVPGRLMMCVESCDSGAYGSSLDVDRPGSRVEDVLENNMLTFSTESVRCNLVLNHCGDTPFSLTRLVIKSPAKSNYRLQEGMVFVTMEKRGLIYRTERYDVRSEAGPKKQRGRHPGRARRTNDRMARTLITEHSMQHSSQLPSNRRHNSWQQSETSQPEAPQRVSASTQTEQDDLQAPSSPQSPYSPSYLEFNVSSTFNFEIPEHENLPDVRQENLETTPQRGYLDDLLNRIASNSQRMDDQRASPPRIGQGTRGEGSNLSEISSAMHFWSRNPPGPDNSFTQEAPLNADSNSSSSYLSSPNTSDEERNPGGRNWRHDTVQAEQSRQLRRQSADGGVYTGPQDPAEGQMRENPMTDAALRNHLLHSYRIWRHGARHKLLSEPRPIEWIPNKIKREGLGEGPSGMPGEASVPTMNTRDEKLSDSTEGPLRPHASFFIHKDEHEVSLVFDPPVAGRYILIKMWAPPDMTSIDVQEIVAYGFAGPRLFPKIDFM